MKHPKVHSAMAVDDHTLVVEFDNKKKEIRYPSIARKGDVCSAEKSCPIDLQIINCTRLEGKIRVRRTLGYVVEDFDRYRRAIIYVKVYIQSHEGRTRRLCCDLGQ